MSTLKDALAQIDKQYGAGSIWRLGEQSSVTEDVIPTGCLPLDLALGVGGFPRGRIVECYGPESCLDADTFIQYEIRSPDGKSQNHKGGSIQRLYERFHGIPREGLGYYQRASTENSLFYAACMNEEGRIFRNRIVDVVDTGSKETWTLRTKNGYQITASADHKFFNGSSFVPLSLLDYGDVVYVHDNTPYRKVESEVSPSRIYLYVKHHGVAGVKVIAGKYRYHRLLRSRAVVEAKMNGLPLDDYIQRLNDGDLGGLSFLPRSVHVHHQDEDYQNDAIENLVVIDPSTHGREHARDRHNNLRFAAHADEIVDIKYEGERHTYDLRMDAPFNNYVANKFVVHNSGKSTLALHAVAEAQKLGDTCAYIDMEMTLDPLYAKAIGVNVDNLLVSQPGAAEEAFGIIDELVSSGEVGLIVVDTVAAMVPRAEIDGDYGDAHVGLLARLMSQALRKLAGAVKRTNTIIIFINQLRENIGVMYGPKEVQPGGRALRFYASVRLDIRRIESIKKGDEVLGNRTRVKVVKNKVAAPHRQAEFDIVFGQGIVKEAALLDVAVQRGIIKKGGSWYSYNDEQIGQGKDNARQFLVENPDVFEEIAERVATGEVPG